MSRRTLHEGREASRLAASVQRPPSPMNRLERFYKIDQLLQERTVVSRDAFLEELEISLATFKRDLEYMRDRLQRAGDMGSGRGRISVREADEVRAAVCAPGLWFNEQEAYALVTMQHLLSSLDKGGLIGPHIAPLMARLDAILGAGEASAGEVRKRIRLLSFGSRKVPMEHFSLIGSAMLKRRRLKMEYYARSTDCALGARGIAAAPGPLPGELVPRHLVPPAQRPAQLLGRWHPAYRNRRHRGKGGVAQGTGRLSARKLRDRARRRGAARKAALFGRACTMGRG